MLKNLLNWSKENTFLFPSLSTDIINSTFLFFIFEAIQLKAIVSGTGTTIPVCATLLYKLQLSFSIFIISSEY